MKEALETLTPEHWKRAFSHDINSTHLRTCKLDSRLDIEMRRHWDDRLVEPDLAHIDFDSMVAPIRDNGEGLDASNARQGPEKAARALELVKRQAHLRPVAGHIKT